MVKVPRYTKVFGVEDRSPTPRTRFSCARHAARARHGPRLLVRLNEPDHREAPLAKVDKVPVNRLLLALGVASTHYVNSLYERRERLAPSLPTVAAREIPIGWLPTVSCYVDRYEVPGRCSVYCLGQGGT